MPIMELGARDSVIDFAQGTADDPWLERRPLDSTDEATVSRYAEADTFGTAVSLGVLDVSGPYFSDRQHWNLFHYLLDGHHKLLAAARAGRPLRLLSFVSVGRSLASPDDFAQFRALVER
ncbi:hypothetical protein ACIBG7_20880 [Nonomuraea sp. NPDC050328]|uniref:hypothetical protein n=1 Tax=Nonomuraea sp. NPDC050328 TaxID=3364361 RepID=UPI0037966D74